jgi:hypothetical protein
MSASDAAPLPRLGEVFFDVRGNSRTMRLSWYADTDVAVFSIWQGGMCTGTFRLPMGDLARMIEILQRGPDGHYERGAAEHGAGDYSGTEYGAGDQRAAGQGGYAESGYDADYHDDYADARDDAPAEAGYGSRPHDPGAYNPRAYDRRAFEPGAFEPGAFEPGAYQPGEYDAGDYGPADYGPGGHPSDGYGEPGYGDAGSGYRDGGQRDPSRRTERYEAADYDPPGYEQAARTPGPAYRHDDGRYQLDATGQRSALADDAGYGQQRFVPPYVRPEPDSSEAGYLDDSGYRPPADPAARSRHSEGRHSSGQAQ